MEKLFGRAYDSIGSSNSDFLIKTKGQVKVQWGNKFIDLIKDGKINVDSDILNIISSKDKIRKDGIYYIEEDGSVILVINGKQINLFGEIGTMYVSFLGPQETKGSEKYQALTNIGFIYKTMEEASVSGLPGGIIYVEDSRKLYIVLNGQLIEYQLSLPNPITQQIVIEKENSEQGALIIKGTGIENSLIVGNIQIYSEEDTSIINSPNSINICILGSEKILIKDNITFKPDVIFDSKINADFIQSKSASSTYGFRLYVENGKSYLEIDNLIVRNSNQDKILAYPFYWATSNNVILSHIFNMTTGEVEISTYQQCTYSEGDIVNIYIDYIPDLELIKIIPIHIKITSSEESGFLGIIQNLSEVQDILDEDKNLKGSYIYLIASSNKNIIRIGEQNIDLYQTSEYDKINDLKNVNTRIGDISALNKEIILQQESRERTVVPEETPIGLFSEAAILNKSQIFNSSIFAPIFKGGPNNDIYPRYDENFEIPKEDNSKTIVTSEWVKSLLKLICPPGTIVQWAGSSVPEGWALCDGSNGTPNLVDKFIKGGTSAGAIGGHKEITLTSDNLPSHTHTLSGSASTNAAGSHRHGVGYSNGDLGDNANNRNNIIGSSTTYTDYAGEHIHTLNLSSVTVGSTGNNAPLNIEPQYYTLMFIMKLDY